MAADTTDVTAWAGRAHLELGHPAAGPWPWRGARAHALGRAAAAGLGRTHPSCSSDSAGRRRRRTAGSAARPRRGRPRRRQRRQRRDRGKNSVAAFRDAETAFLETGNEQHLDRWTPPSTGSSPVGGSRRPPASGCSCCGTTAPARTRRWMPRPTPSSRSRRTGRPLAGRAGAPARWWRDGDAADLDRAIELGSRPASNAAPSPLGRPRRGGPPTWRRSSWSATGFTATRRI